MNTLISTIGRVSREHATRKPGDQMGFSTRMRRAIEPILMGETGEGTHRKLQHAWDVLRFHGYERQGNEALHDALVKVLGAKAGHEGDWIRNDVCHQRKAERALQPEEGRALPDGELSLDQLMKVFDMGLGFALCHRDFTDTRNAVKKLQEDFKVIQQRASQLALPAGPVPEGWITWNGGDKPANADGVIDVLTRCGEKVLGVNYTANWSWKHSGAAADIMAYRRHSPAVAQPVAA